MLIEVNDELVARLAIGANSSSHQFYFPSKEGNASPPLLVDVLARSEGLYFKAHRANRIVGEVTLTFDEIFNNISRVSRLLKELESGVPS